MTPAYDNSQRISRWRRLVVAAVVLAVAATIWELLGSRDGAHPGLMPAPSLVLSALWSAWTAGNLQVDILASLWRVCVGFSIGSILGFGVGVLYLNDRARLILSPLVEIVRPIPPIAWIPLSLLWFGFGNPPAYFLTALGAFFPMMSAAHLGFARTEISYARAATSLGIDKRQTFLKVILPQALPSILSGARVGIGVAWMIVVTAELVGAESGLGYMIQISRAQLQSELVIGGMLVIGIVGFMLSELVSMLEHLLTPWRFRGREVGLE